MHSGESALRRIARGLALGGLGLFLFAGRASSQTPTLPNASSLPPGAAAQLLRTRPDLVAQLRDRLASANLTPDQVRARLRALGYPEDLLDEYLAGADSTRATAPSKNTVDALKALGVVGTESADSLLQLVGDSLQVDSLDVEGGQDTFSTDTLRGARTRRPLPLRVFGVDVFRQRTTQFQAVTSGPVDANYLLGPGDLLVLILTGDVEQATQLEVNREGFIVIPQVGQVYVANLTLGQLEDVLYTRLARVYSGIRRGGGTTRFQLSVARLRNLQVFVAGDVAKPGAFQISSAGTVLTALYAAGGPTERGSLRHVEVRRGSAVVGTMDVYDYLLRGENRSDIRLRSGDVIFVKPRGALVSINGAVLRPARYELRPAETLRDLVAAAGGYEANALRAKVQVHRIVPPDARSPDGRDRVLLDVQAVEDGVAAPALPLAAGDSVVVFEVRPRVRQFVSVKGAVWIEGRVGLAEDMRLSDALRLAGGVRPEALLGTVLVSRLNADSSRAQLRSTLRDSTGTLTDDLVLREDDEVTVFSRLRVTTPRYISITGSVRKPGRLSYREGMTLRDAVLLANGLTEDALLDVAEVARLPENRGSGALAATMKVPLDSSYVYERTPAGAYQGPPGLPSPRGGAPEVLLRPYDNVLILRQPNWELLRRVTIAGQVKYPGVYALQTRTERLSDVLTRAGGLTGEAYPAGVRFVRTQDRRGRIGIDLPRVLAKPEFGDNLILADGDSITIPEYNPVVTVDGAVNSPIAVTHVPGKSLDFYIASAGGFSRLADRGRAYVQQPTGKVESGRARKPLAGARVFVPSRDPNEPRVPTLQILTTAAGIFTSLATIILVARQ